MGRKFETGDPRTIAAARKGGRRSRALARARKPLDLIRVDRELPPLTSITNVVKRLDVIARWSCAGLLRGLAASAAVRSCEVYIRARESEITDEVAGRLRARLDALEQELRRRPKVVS